MKLKINIDRGNAAFDENPDEASRILRSLADHLESRGSLGEKGGKLFDVNGNNVGTWELKK